MRCLLWGASGYLFFQVLRCQCEGLSRTKPGMVIGFIGLMSNIPINYVFIHGKLGMPALGGVGCGVATASVYWIMFLLLRGYMRRTNTFRDLRLTGGLQKPDPVALKRLFTLSALVALLVAPLSIIAVAGHQIALNFSSLMFVLPLSIGVAATIRIGFRLGEGDFEQARVSSRSSLMIGVTLACCTALFTSLLRERIALLYNDTPAVLAMASHLMLLAAIYQISDSIQVIGNGVLSGYKDTRSIFFNYLYCLLAARPALRVRAGADGLAVPRHGSQRFLDWVYCRSDLCRRFDDVPHALAAAPDARAHFASGGALRGMTRLDR